jgi:hypothetical protein
MMQRLDLASRVAGNNERPPWVRGGGNETTDTLERLECQWIAKVNDAHCRELPEDLEARFDRIMEYEAGLGPHGRDARVTRLRWEREHWIIRRATAETIQQMARDTEAGERSDPPGQWSAPPPPAEPVHSSAAPLASCPPYEDPPDPIERAYAMSDTIMAAGGMAGQRRRGTGSTGFVWRKG